MLSVIFATHNGERTLGKTLAAMARATRPAQGVEFIVIDNASTDHTPRILQSYKNRLPLTILEETRRGKSYALNRGLRTAEGQFLVFTDDDVLPDAQWLEAYVEAARTSPEVALFAGQVRHAWETPPPRWLTALADAGMSYAGTPVDRQAGAISHGEVKGPNFMVRRQCVQHTHFCEQHRVNYTGTHTSAGGVETRFALDLLGEHGMGVYVPSACVRHIVRADQIGVWPVFQRYMRIGAGTVHREFARLEKLDGSHPKGVAREIWNSAYHGAGSMYHLVHGRKEMAARQMTRLAKTIGRMRERRRIARLAP